MKKVALATVTLLIIALGLLGHHVARSSDTTTIRATRIELVNQAGTAVMILEADSNGDGRITVLDHNQNQVGSFPTTGTSARTQVQKSTTTSPSGDGQCQAITKKGTRCSRKAQSGSAYCWQHQR